MLICSFSLFICSFSCSYIRSFNHSFIQVLSFVLFQYYIYCILQYIWIYVHSFMCWFLHVFIPSCVHSFMCWFLPVLIPSCVYSFMCWFLHVLIPSCVHSFIYSFLRVFIPSFKRRPLSFHCSIINPKNHTSVNKWGYGRTTGPTNPTFQTLKGQTRIVNGASFHPPPLIAPRGGPLTGVHLSSLPRSVSDGLSIPINGLILTSSRFHLQWSFLILFHPLDRDRFQPDPGRRIILEHLPHVALRQTEQVGVSDRPNGGRSPVPQRFPCSGCWSRRSSCLVGGWPELFYRSRQPPAGALCWRCTSPFRSLLD